MSGLSSGGMEPEEPNSKEKKINDEVISFLLKRSEHDIPQYCTRIKTYLDVKRRRQRANEARRNIENEKTKKKTEDTKDINAEDKAFVGNDDDGESKRSCRVKGERSRPESRKQEPVDRCCRRRRRRSCRRRRRRSCSRRRRRRRRRSCSRRRRRRSCRRRRRRRRCRR
ncbi:protamine-2-like [Pieris napi]|uniref:protamine-2-like n=1 Tax=Pieris napi TaxID=78633 RepID=UPI001FBA08EF|nr:protamine-2-like [Pieris napi]